MKKSRHKNNMFKKINHLLRNVKNMYIKNVSGVYKKGNDATHPPDDKSIRSAASATTVRCRPK
jgi:hypothetical protein